MKNTKRQQRQMEKFRLEIRHFDYLKEKGLTSLEIADTLVHQMFEMMKMGLKNRYPHLSPNEISMKMREISKQELEIRNKRIR